MEQANLQEKEKNINETSQKNEGMLKKMNNFEYESKNLSPKELEKKLEELNNEIKNELSNLKNESIVEYVSSCEPSDYYIYTHCDSCQRNCHDYCDCDGNILGRCIRFNWEIFEDTKCDECGCLKEKHKIDNYHWIKKSVNKEKGNKQQIQEEKENQNILEEINKENSKSNLENQINELNKNKNILKKEQKKIIQEQNEIKEKIKYANNQITFIIIKLKRISEKIGDITLNRSHLRTEDEFIDSLKDKMKQIGLNDEEQKNNLKMVKENLKIFRKVNQLKEDEPIKLDDPKLVEKLGIIIPIEKNSN